MWCTPRASHFTFSVSYSSKLAIYNFTSASPYFYLEYEFGLCGPRKFENTSVRKCSLSTKQGNAFMYVFCNYHYRTWKYCLRKNTYAHLRLKMWKFDAINFSEIRYNENSSVEKHGDIRRRNSKGENLSLNYVELENRMRESGE